MVESAVLSLRFGSLIILSLRMLSGWRARDGARREGGGSQCLQMY